MWSLHQAVRGLRWTFIPRHFYIVSRIAPRPQWVTQFRQVNSFHHPRRGPPPVAGQNIGCTQELFAEEVLRRSGWRFPGCALSGLCHLRRKLLGLDRRVRRWLSDRHYQGWFRLARRSTPTTLLIQPGLFHPLKAWHRRTPRTLDTLGTGTKLLDEFDILGLVPKPPRF